MENSITFVVPVHGEQGLFLPRCIHSLLDQDYEYKNIVVVYDGKNQTRTALMQEDAWKQDDRVKFIHLEERVGAPNARNKGMDNSDGDIICFFDCDSMLRPGAIRIWMQAFKDNPECGFVYGGYRFTMKDAYSPGVAARPFDRYLLTCNNYISTMNPIKREHVVEWDKDLKSLQDWDFWLRVTEKGIIGKFIPDLLVITESPTKGSITGDSHRNWIERYTAVREKNGIVSRNHAFTSFGAEFQSIRRAKICGADYRNPFMLINKPHDYDAVISMGYYVDTQQVGPSSIFENLKEGAKKIVYWIGTDVLQLSNRSFKAVKEYKNRLAKHINHQFTNAPWLQEELKGMGIDAELLYCPIDVNNYEITPYPKEFTIAFYRQNIDVQLNPIYNEDFMLEVANALPDVKFKFFGGTVPNYISMLPKNVEYLGTVPEYKMKELIDSTSAIVRLTRHDGFPATIAEWIMSGRKALCNLEDMPLADYVPFTSLDYKYVQEKEAVIEAIRKLQEECKKVDKDEQEKAREFYGELLAPQTFVERINEVVNEKSN